MRAERFVAREPSRSLLPGFVTRSTLRIKYFPKILIFKVVVLGLNSPTYNLLKVILLSANNYNKMVIF